MYAPTQGAQTTQCLQVVMPCDAPPVMQWAQQLHDCDDAAMETAVCVWLFFMCEEVIVIDIDGIVLKTSASVKRNAR